MQIVKESNSATEKVEKQLIQATVAILLAVVILAAILVPIIDTISNERRAIIYHNEDATGFDLSLFTADSDNVPNYNCTVTLNDDTVTISGIGSKSADDMVIMLSDTQALFVKNGMMYSYNDGITESTQSKTITLTQTELNGMPYEWVYFPELNGKFASFPDGFQYNFSRDVVSVGSFANVTLISQNTEITSENPYDMTTFIQTDGTDIVGVIYEQETIVEPLM